MLTAGGRPLVVSEGSLVEANRFRHTYNTLRPTRHPGERTPRADYLAAGHCDERVAFGGPLLDWEVQT
jgi:hypothetical protein